MLKRFAAAGLILAAAAGAVLAQSEAIAQRQQLMKATGAATGAAGAMLKGEKPFDLAVVQNSLKTYVEVSEKFGKLFPEDSKTGAKTAALPAIWEKKADFDARLAKLDADARAAAAAIKDEATFKANFPNVLKNCGGCHELYRAKAS